jgi:uncharacterized protein Smg (DUF494 family)
MEQAKLIEVLKTLINVWQEKEAEIRAQQARMREGLANAGLSEQYVNACIAILEAERNLYEEHAQQIKFIMGT